MGLGRGVLGCHGSVGVPIARGRSQGAIAVAVWAWLSPGGGVKAPLPWQRGRGYRKGALPRRRCYGDGAWPAGERGVASAGRGPAGNGDGFGGGPEGVAGSGPTPPHSPGARGQKPGCHGRYRGTVRGQRGCPPGVPAGAGTPRSSCGCRRCSGRCFWGASSATGGARAGGSPPRSSTPKTGRVPPRASLDSGRGRGTPLKVPPCPLEAFRGFPFIWGGRSCLRFPRSERGGVTGLTGPYWEPAGGLSPSPPLGDISQRQLRTRSC